MSGEPVADLKKPAQAVEEPKKEEKGLGDDACVQDQQQEPGRDCVMLIQAMSIVSQSTPPLVRL
jgi:hypothetical protein